MLLGHSNHHFVSQKTKKKLKCNIQIYILIKFLTSSTFSPISSVALQIAFVVPVMVTIRSGVEPSEIKTLAPDYKNN